MNRLKSQSFTFLAFSTIFIILNFSIFSSQTQAVPEKGEAGPAGKMRMSCPMQCEAWPEKLALLMSKVKNWLSLNQIMKLYPKHVSIIIIKEDAHICRF